jgi:hypothetical protein
MTLLDDLARLKDELINIPVDLGHPNYVEVRIENNRTNELLVQKYFKMKDVKVKGKELVDNVNLLNQLRELDLPNNYVINEDHIFEVLTGPEVGKYELHYIDRGTISQRVVIRSKYERR